MALETEIAIGIANAIGIGIEMVNWSLAGWIGLLVCSFRIYRRPMVSEICQMNALRKGTTKRFPTTIAGNRFEHSIAICCRYFTVTLHYYG